MNRKAISFILTLVICVSLVLPVNAAETKTIAFGDGSITVSKVLKETTITLIIGEERSISVTLYYLPTTYTEIIFNDLREPIELNGGNFELKADGNYYVSNYAMGYALQTFENGSYGTIYEAQGTTWLTYQKKNNWINFFLPYGSNIMNPSESDFLGSFFYTFVEDELTATEKPSAGKPVTPELLIVNPTKSTVYLNGEAKAFEAYNIGGSNYFKLRDLAFVLNGTEKQFGIGYDNNTKAITLASGESYTAVGGEMAAGDGKSKTAVPTPSKIYLDSKELNIIVYNIAGSNFFKLRDLMQAIDVYVGYDNATGAITLDTGKGY